MARRHKRFLGIGKRLGKNQDKLIILLTIGGIGLAGFFILSGRKSGVGPLDTSLQSIGTFSHLEGAGGKIPVLGSFFPSGAGPSGGASTLTTPAGGGGAPKLTPTAAASSDGADRFSNFSQAYWARSYAGRRTNDIVDRLTLS
jgi:hypothetical protein